MTFCIMPIVIVVLVLTALINIPFAMEGDIVSIAAVILNLVAASFFLGRERGWFKRSKRL